MKNLRFLILLILPVLFSCQKKNTPEVVPNAVPTWKERVKAQDGILIFPNWEDEALAKAELEAMSFTKLEMFGKKHNFVSQRYVFETIVREEEQQLISFANQYPNGLTYKEAKAQGIKKPTHTYAYLDALKKGIIRIEEDSDTTSTYVFSVNNPTIVTIVNEDGFVQVGNDLWQFTDRYIKSINGGIAQKEVLKKATISDEQKELLVIDIAELQRVSSYNWDFTPSASPGESNNWRRPIEGNSNRRAKYERKGFSNVTASTCGAMVSEFFVNVFAQRQYLFVWSYSNSFTPTFTFNGDWSFNFQKGCNGVDCYPTCNYSSLTPQFGVTLPPMVGRTYFGNNSVEAFPMHPHRDSPLIGLYSDAVSVNFSSWSGHIGSTPLQ